MTLLHLAMAQKSDTAVARSVALRFARECGLAERSAQEVAIIAGELASNVVRHATTGVLELEWRDGFVIVRSLNTGFDVIPRALRESAGDSPAAVDERGTWRGGLGCGFGAVRRLSDGFRVRRRDDGALEISASRRGP